jgi:hypothetical protein
VCRSRELDRAELTQQARFIGNDPDARNNITSEGEDVDRLHFDVAVAGSMVPLGEANGLAGRPRIKGLEAVMAAPGIAEYPWRAGAG